MENGNKNRHLTAAERQIIAAGISNGSSKAAIAETLGKEKSTIGKEIKLHRYLKHKCNMPLECANYRKCANGRQCTPDCPEYVPFSCKRRDRSPGACNGCQNMSHCRFDKYIYDPAQAEQEYKETFGGIKGGGQPDNGRSQTDRGNNCSAGRQRIITLCHSASASGT